MTKIIKIGDTPRVAPPLKPIKFSHCLSLCSLCEPMATVSGVPVTIHENTVKSRDYKYVELICTDYLPGIDIMFAYDDPSQRSRGVLFLGKFNDGVVE